MNFNTTPLHFKTVNLHDCYLTALKVYVIELFCNKLRRDPFASSRNSFGCPHGLSHTPDSQRRSWHHIVVRPLAQVPRLCSAWERPSSEHETSIWVVGDGAVLCADRHTQPLEAHGMPMHRNRGCAQKIS